MHPVRAAALLFTLLAIHDAIDGAVPLWLGWKVKLGMVPFFLSGVLLVVSFVLFVTPSRTRAFGFTFACCGVFICAASVIVPFALDGEFGSNSYPYPGGKLFGVIQLAGFVVCAALLRRRFASNKLLQATCEDARA
jgi:drug/metabolite transporter superfamily protein YnfA